MSYFRLLHNVHTWRAWVVRIYLPHLLDGFWNSINSVHHRLLHLPSGSGKRVALYCTYPDFMRTNNAWQQLIHPWSRLKATEMFKFKPAEIIRFQIPYIHVYVVVQWWTNNLKKKQVMTFFTIQLWNLPFIHMYIHRIQTLKSHEKKFWFLKNKERPCCQKSQFLSFELTILIYGV